MFKLFNKSSKMNTTITHNLTQDLLNELECPVCMEYLLPPIVLCVNGHNICPRCKPKLKKCSICRQPFVNIRNVALEKLARQIKYPCTYWREGCTVKVNLDLKDKHEKVCPYNQYRCPLIKVNALLH
jgi:E3 ubiquitin-protein ligase SIAH1